MQLSWNTVIFLTFTNVFPYTRLAVA